MYPHTSDICLSHRRYRFLEQLACFSYNVIAVIDIYTLSLHDALPISAEPEGWIRKKVPSVIRRYKNRETALPGLVSQVARSEEHTSELQSLRHLVCRLLLEKKKLKY